MTGTIAAINGSVGETMGNSSSSAASGGSDDAASSTSASSSFITLAKLHRFKIEVSLSESDIGKVKKGSTTSSSSSSAVSYSVFLAFGAALLSGLFFGTYPAGRAASLRPIEALRYE